MAYRFVCIATSRRRRALSASLGSSSARRRRANAAMRRANGVWPDGRRGTALLAGDADGVESARTAAPDPLPAILSRR